MMQQNPYAGFEPVGRAPAPAAMPSPAPAGANPYAGFERVGSAPAPQQAPRRAQSGARPAAPAVPSASAGPAPLLTVEEMAAANMASGYDPTQAWELAQEDFANQSQGADPGMAPAQPAAERADAVDEWFMRRDATRASGAPVQPLDGVDNEQVRATAERAFAAPQSGGSLQFQPWRAREPRFASGEPGGVDPETGDPEVNRAGVLDLGGGRFEIYDADSDAYYPATQADVDAYQRQLAGDRKGRIARLEREADPKYQAEYAAAQQGAESVPAWLANLSHGNNLGALTHIVGASNFLAPMTEGIDRGLAGQAGRDAWRDRMDSLIGEDPVGSVGMQMLGGLLTPGVKGSGDWIAGATGAARSGRAAAVGGGYGLASGVLNSEGDVVSDGLLGAGVGAATGGLLDMGARRMAAGAAARSANPGPVRQLSRAGVNMMPGQLLSGVPVLGRVARGLEQGAASIPLAGAVPAAAERESVRSFDRAAINQVLGIIGESLPRGVSGREAIRAGDDIISARYNADLNPVTIMPNPQINARIQAAISPRNMSAATRDRLSDSAQDIVARLGQPITGQEWKLIDSELSAAINSASRGGPADRPLAQGLREVRAALGDALEQAYPGTLARVRETDDAFGNFQLIRRAASNPTTGRNDGLFTPSNLNSVLARSEGRAYGRGEARLQNLVDPAEGAMAGTLPNSGSAERLATIGLASGAATTGTILNPAVAIPTVVGVSALYSAPVQRLINAIYRSTDRQSGFSALAELQELAGRNPALQEYYADAARYLQGAFPDQGTAQTPEVRGLLSPSGR